MTLADRMSIPTQQSVGRNSHAPSINAFNLQLRQQPWYQDWFRQQGLDPNRVHLSKGQRQQLEQVIIQRGGVPADAFNDMQIDPAGNLNTEHGFRSQPTWLKALEIGAVATGAAFAAPGSIGSLVGMGGAPTTAVAPTAIPTMSAVYGGAPIVAAGAAPIAASAAAPIAAAVAPAAAKTGFSIGSLFGRAAPALVNAGANIYGTHAATSANRDAANVQAQSAREALDYTKTHDTQQRQDFLDTQNRNFALYQEAQARLDPYRRFGRASLDQLMRPIPGVGTLGARM